MSTNLKKGKNAVEERLRKFARPVKPEEMNRMAGTEDRGRRTRSSKIFSLGRGLYQAVMYPEAVHFKNKATGELQEIDNTLIPVTDTAGDTYLTNRCNDELKVEFHNAQAAAMILMQTEDGRMLSWKLENAQPVQPKIINAVKPRHAEDDRRRDVLDKLEGEVVYENVIPGVDMNCSVQALRFKDFFTFKDLASAQPVTFLVSMPDMVPEKMEDGSIQVIAPTGEVAFTLPKPFLKDASVEAAYGAVAVTMEPAGEAFTWRITFAPDMAWMQTAQFPVILDPAVITKNHSSAIEDNFVTSAYPNTVQSYSDTGMTVSYSSSSWGTSRAFIKYLATGLPAIDSSYYITKAMFSVKTKSAPTTAASIYLKEVSEYWDSQAITYNNAPDLTNVKPLDYQYMDADETWYTYDISNLVRKWYGGENNGFALESTTRTYLELYTSDNAYNKPYITINYVSLAGLEDYLVYEDQDVGRAGVGHVSLYNGNLIFERQDTSCSGNRMPVSISHIYNSCYRNVTAFGAGAGWKMNVQQTLHRETLTDESDGSTSTYYVYMDEDGTRHHFKYANSEWTDQSGKGMELTISGSTATITDKGHNTWVFDLPTVEFNNNYANVKMLKTLSDACGNTMTVTATGNVLENVEDGIGRNTGFFNSSNRVNTIYSPGFGESGACGFEYDANGRLTHVWELAGQPGTENMYYTYDANGLLLSATNCDGVKVTYEYYTAREPFRVKRVRITGTEEDGTVLCAYDRTYEYKDCLTVVTDNLSGKKLFYHFNDYGNCVSVNDQLGYACFAKYSDTYPVNHPETISKMQRAVVNLLPNHNFEASESWSTVSYGGTGTYTYATDQKYMGTKSMKVNKTNADGNMCVYMNFEYDVLGRLTVVKVGNQVLSTTTYNEDGTVQRVDYGNDDSVEYSYDEFKRTKGVRYNWDYEDRYVYEYGANGQVAQLTNTDILTVTTSEHDAAGRPARITRKHLDTGAHLYTGEVSYDEFNNLKTFKEQVGSDRAAYTTTFTHDNENRPTLLNFGSSRQVAYVYDGLGRISRRTVNAGSIGVATTYGYLAGGHGTGSTTPLVQTITQSGTTLTYAYDDAGNITSVSDGSKTISYEYDLLGQLTRVNDPYDTTAGSTGTTWKYAYDQGGNIQSKTAYVFTTGTVGSAVKTDSFTYGDTNWKDKLTAFNGQTITYDAIGNPTNDGTWNYTWGGGSQMRAMYKGEFGEQGYDEITFEYNENGLRTKKTRMYYDDATGDIGYKATNYTLHGKNIVHLSDGSNELHFFYDAQNKPAVVIYNGAAYTYLYNMQGDVIALLDNNGSKMVSYTYDAWGKPISKTGTLAGSLGTLNPFRYRAYAFDEETNIYYLCSRYYNPNICRFVTADSVVVNDRLIVSCYAYCKNNPVTYRDDDGKFLKALWEGVQELANAVTDAVLDIVSTPETTNERKGSLIAAGITLLGTIVTVGVAVAISAAGSVPFAVAALGAAVITGPVTLVTALTANYCKEDYSDDGQGNRSVSTPEQWQNVGIGALEDYGSSMVGAAVGLNGKLSAVYSGINRARQIGGIMQQTVPRTLNAAPLNNQQQEQIIMPPSGQLSKPALTLQRMKSPKFVMVMK